MKILKTEGDTIFVIYDPVSQRLKVGENFRIADNQEEYLAMVVEDSVPELPGILESVVRAEIFPKPEQEYGVKPSTLGATERLKLAKLKVLRKVTKTPNGSRVTMWDGSMPSRVAKLEPISIQDLLKLLELESLPCK